MAGDGSRKWGLRQVLGDVLRRIDPEHRLEAFEVWSFWKEAVGEALARRTQPTAYRNGVLIVAVSAHVWLQELQFMKEALREQLNARLGQPLIRDIYFASGSVEGREVSAQSAAGTEPVPPRSIAMPAIADPELSAAFRRIVRAHVRRVPAAARRRLR